MITVNFITGCDTIAVFKDTEGKEEERAISTHRYIQTTKLPPGSFFEGMTVKFGLPGCAEEDLVGYEIEKIELDMVSKEWNVSLQSYAFGSTLDVQEEAGLLEKMGFKLHSFIEYEGSDD